MKTRNGVQILDSLATVAASDWNALADGDPLLSHAFLHALHETGCAGADSGWAPCYLTLWKSGALAGAMPLYLKSHSYGEYVFDWAWADAYQRHGLDYYPKLLCAVPFTPVNGPRLLAPSEADREILARRRSHLRATAGCHRCTACFRARRGRDTGVGRNDASRHGAVPLVQPGLRRLRRLLSRMNHDKRKKIRQERRRVRDAGISFRWIRGAEASQEEWRFFVDCYNRTYRSHHSTPYLNLEFFLRLAAAMPENLLLILGYRDSRPVAAAFNIISPTALYGRYWGAMEFHSGLHFETCYYQAIEFCIANGIAVFEGGAQGEHKLARGLLPVRTVSAHWLARPEFADAVAKFLQRETRGIAHYVDELGEHSPFKQTDPAGA